MSYSSADILHFTEYTFNDTGHVAQHFGLVIVPSHLTQFKASILCAVVTSQEPKFKWGTHTLDHSNYPCFSKTTHVRLRDLDYVPLAGLNKGVSQPVGHLTDEDGREVFKRLKKVIFAPSSPVDKYLRGAIIREWRKQYPPLVSV